MRRVEPFSPLNAFITIMTITAGGINAVTMGRLQVPLHRLECHLGDVPQHCGPRPSPLPAPHAPAISSHGSGTQVPRGTSSKYAAFSRRPAFGISCRPQFCLGDHRRATLNLGDTLYALDSMEISAILTGGKTIET